MWTSSKDVKYGIAICNFDGKYIPHGLTINIGDTVQIFEQCKDWYRGCHTQRKPIKGIFPASYIQSKPCRVDVDGPHATVTPEEDPVVREVAFVLREWGHIWKKLFVERKAPMYSTIHSVMLDLMEARKELMSETITQEQGQEIKGRITAKIDWGNKKLGLDLVPRIDHEPVDCESISPVELYHLHEESVKIACDATNRGSLRAKKSTPVTPNHHMFMSYKNFGCNVGEETELHFQLYDAKTSSFFTERYMMKMTKNGLPLDFEKPDQFYALFTDLGRNDLIRDAYLVCHIYRKGNLRDESSKKSSASIYRRPYGCAATSIKDILMGNIEQDLNQELQLKIFSSNESEFPQLLENIIRKQGTKFNMQSSLSNYGIVVGLKMLHGDLEEVMKTDPVLFKNMTITRKMGFPDVIMPGDARNDLYLTLNRGEFDKGSKTSGKNIEIEVKAYNGDGELILECICPGSGERKVSRYTSVIFYHCNQPKWNDIIKLDIPIELFKSQNAHLRLEFRHCSTRDKTEKKMFAFSFIRLVAPDGTTLKDGPHELFLWKCDDKNKLDCAQRYIGLPCATAEIKPEIGNTGGNNFFRRSEKEYVYIETKLCSTKLTQNADLLSVLRWRDHPGNLDQTLRKLMALPGHEVVNYLQDILDALFSMFQMENGKLIPQAHLVFQALFHIFNLVEDRKFEHFKPVIDTYLSYHFSAVLVFRDLLVCLKETLEVLLSSSSNDQQYFHNCFKVMEFLVKFIVQARLLFIRASIVDSDLDKGFISMCDEVFDAIKQVISLNFDLITTSQGILLNNIPKVVGELSKVYPQLELCHIFCSLIKSMPEDHTDKIHRKKLRCIRDVANLPILKCSECKKSFLHMCSFQLLHYLKARQELKLCSEILSDILTLLHEDQSKKVYGTTQNIQTLLSVLLDLMVRILLDHEESVTVSNHLVACLVTLLRLMDADQYKALLNDLRDSSPVRDFLLRMLMLFERLVQKAVFPADWMIMRMNMNQVILETLPFLSQTLSETFLSGINFDYELWKTYFSLAVGFLTQPSLQLEKFSEVKRQKVRERYGDMRVRMGYEILSMWQNLDNHKLHFVPNMVGPFLEVTLIPETELRKATLPIFYDMMECERNHRGNFKQVESELIDKLDILINENKGDEEYKQLFNTILLQKVQSESSWNENDGASFVQSVTRLLERLLDYRKVLEGEENREKRMTCTVNLLNFYKNEINREEMYIRYIHKLCDLQLSSRNHTEAAFTMLLHAELLEWGDRELEAERNLPLQPEWERKELIYRQIIAYFDIGKSWEYGIPLCEELAEQYKKRVMYKKLSDILQLQATFYEKILGELRPNPEYFRVGFYGQKFPLFLRNKEFVYRGNDYERMGSFQQRILSEFSGAALLNTTASLTDSLRLEESQYIMISPVKPVADLDPVFTDPCVPEPVQNFYRFNEVSQFLLDRPYQKGEKDDANEFKTLCIERTKLKTSNKLPGILRWFEVIHSETTRLSPIETAIDTMEKKNRELRVLTAACSSQKLQHLNPLTMVLNGTIDAAVQGGIKKYQEAFFTDDFVLSNPDDVKHISHLKTLFLDQIQLLNHALKVHGRLVPEIAPNVLPLHNRLQDLFKSMKQGIKETGSPNMARLLGVTEALTQMTAVTSQRRSGSSLSSISPSMTPPGSGSNRSSEAFPEDSVSVDSGTSCHPSESANPMIGFGSLGINTSLTCLNYSSPNVAANNKPQSHHHQQSYGAFYGKRPRSAVLLSDNSHQNSTQEETSSFSQRKESKGRSSSSSVFYVGSQVPNNTTQPQCNVIRPPSDPALYTSKSTYMKGAPSSISLDSGVSVKSGVSSRGFRSQSTTDGQTPPKPPPRKPSLPNGDTRDSSPYSGNRIGPSLPPRNRQALKTISTVNLKNRLNSEESPSTTPTRRDPPDVFSVKVASPVTDPTSNPLGRVSTPISRPAVTSSTSASLGGSSKINNNSAIPNQYVESPEGQKITQAGHKSRPGSNPPPIPVKKRSLSSSAPTTQELGGLSFPHSSSFDFGDSSSNGPPPPIPSRPRTAQTPGPKSPVTSPEQ